MKVELAGSVDTFDALSSGALFACVHAEQVRYCVKVEDGKDARCLILAPCLEGEGAPSVIDGDAFSERAVLRISDGFLSASPAALLSRLDAHAAPGSLVAAPSGSFMVARRTGRKVYVCLENGHFADPPAAAGIFTAWSICQTGGGGAFRVLAEFPAPAK